MLKIIVLIDKTWIMHQQTLHACPSSRNYFLLNWQSDIILIVTLCLLIASFNFGDFDWDYHSFWKEIPSSSGSFYSRSRGWLSEWLVPSADQHSFFLAVTRAWVKWVTVRCSPSRALTAETRCTNSRALRRTDAGNSSHSPKQGRKQPCTVWLNMTGSLTSR